MGKLIHLGIEVVPNKSTLAYANRHRPAALYENLFYAAPARLRDVGGLGQRKRKFRFKNKLLSLDSTTISFCLEMFPDHGRSRTGLLIPGEGLLQSSLLVTKFRRAKGGVKAHVLLDHDDYMPSYVLIDAFPLNPGSIVTMDRGYSDYALFGRWTERKIYCCPGQQWLFLILGKPGT